ncbi:MAG: 30S ribosomal protein S20 [Puniceicoccales bacterium]|jgi:small subunit ribosomal protein S20|nr:30S ribosomal protein S20 [Puniceicoccales bacterium]
MANIKSSQKSIRQTAKLTAKNKAERGRLKTFSKKLRALEPTNDKGAIKLVAMEYMSALDKAAKRNVIHTNKVNRLKSRLAKHIFISIPEEQPVIPEEKPVEQVTSAE